MDFKQLEAFVNVVNLKSFSKAGKKIFLSQPSVSAYIISLENELGVKLIYRSTKEVYPTKTGEIFYAYAKNILSIKNKAILETQNKTENITGEIEIVASSVPSQYILPKIFGAFHKIHRDISFKVIERDTLEVITGIEKQRYEFGVVGAKIPSGKCEYEFLLKDELVIIAPNTEKYKNINVLQNEEKIIKLFNDEYFISREIGSGTRIAFEKSLKDMGINLNKIKISATFNDTESIIQSVANGLGFSIVSKIAAKSFIDKEEVLLIDSKTLNSRDYFFVFKNDFNIYPVSKNFIDFAREFCASNF